MDLIIILSVYCILLSTIIISAMIRSYILNKARAKERKEREELQRKILLVYGIPLTNIREIKGKIDTKVEKKRPTHLRLLK